MRRNRGAIDTSLLCWHVTRPARFSLLFSAAAFASLNVQGAAATVVVIDDKNEKESELLSGDWVIDLLTSFSGQPHPAAPESLTLNEIDTADERNEPLKIETPLVTFQSALGLLSVPKLAENPAEQNSIAIVAKENSGLEMTASHALGPDAVTKTNHLAHASLQASDAWNIEVDAIWKAENKIGVSYETALGIYSNRQPFLKSHGGVGLSDPEFWLQESVFDAGIKVVTRNEKYSFTGGLSFSEAGFERHFSSEPWLISLESTEAQAVERERSLDRFLSFDANLIHADQISLDVGIDYSKSAGRSRSNQSKRLGEAIFPGDYFGTEFAGEIYDFTLQLETSTLRSRSYDLDATNLHFSDGRNRLNLSLDRERLRHENLVVADDENFQVKLRSDLAQSLPNLPEWAPDEVQVGAQSVKSVENFFGSSRDAETHSIGGGFAKHGKRFYTDVYAFFATRRENETHLLPKTHTELGLDIVHELYLDDFDMSAYVSINNLESRRDKRDDASDRSVSGGISISYAPGDTPALSLSADLYQDTADFFFDEFSYRSHEYSLQAEAELLHLFHFWEDRNPGRSSAFNLTLNAYHGWNEYREAALPSKNNETRALIRLTNRF